MTGVTAFIHRQDISLRGVSQARPPERRGRSSPRRAARGGKPARTSPPRLPATLAELEPEGGGTLLRMRVSSLDWMAGVLAGLGCGFTIRRPGELRASVAALARRLAESASSD